MNKLTKLSIYSLRGAIITIVWIYKESSVEQKQIMCTFLNHLPLNFVVVFSEFYDFRYITSNVYLKFMVPGF